VLVGHLGGSMSPVGGRKTVISESVCQPSERVAGLGKKDRIWGDATINSYAMVSVNPRGILINT